MAQDLSNNLTEGNVSGTSLMTSKGRLADTSFAKAMEGAAGVAGMAVKAADDFFQDRMEDDVDHEVDKANQEFGVDGAAAGEESVDLPQSLPGDVEDSIKNLEAFKTAVSHGKATQGTYDLRMRSVVRQLRAKYPGYRDEIDRKVGRSLGYKPANAIRSQLRAQENAAAAGTNNILKRQQQKLAVAVSKGAFPATVARMAEKINAGIPISSREESYLDSSNAEANLQEALMDRDIKALTLNKGTMLAKERGAQKTIKKSMTWFSNALFNDALGKGESVQQMADRMSAGGYDLEEKGQLHRARELHRNLLTQQWHTLAATKMGDGTLSDYLMTGDDVGTAVEKALQPQTFLIQGIIGKNTSDMKIAEEWKKWRNEEATSNALLGATGITLGMLNSLPPEIRVTFIDSLMSNVGATNNFAKAIQAGLFSTTVDGKKRPLYDTLGEIKTHNKVAGDDQQFGGQDGVHSVGVIKSAAISGTPEMKKNAISMLLTAPKGSNLLQRFRGKNKDAVFQMMTDPTLIKTILAENGGEAPDAYRDFLVGGFVELNKESMTMMARQSNEDSLGMKLTYNEQGGFAINKENAAGGWAQLDRGVVKRMGKAIADTNRWMRAYRATGLGDENLKKDFSEALSAMNISTNPDDGGGLLFKMMGAFTNWLEGGDDNKKSSNSGDEPTISPAGASVGNHESFAQVLDPVEARGDYDMMYNSYQEKLGISPSTMSVGELLELADGDYGTYSKGATGRKATPYGRYQIVSATMKDLMGPMKLDGSEVFTPELQDKMFEQLLLRRGLQKYRDGKIGFKTFADNMEKEWAGLKKNPMTRENLRKVAAMDLLKYHGEL